MTGEGLASDQTALLHFGLGQDTEVRKVSVQYSNGRIVEIDTPTINSIVDVKSERGKQQLRDSLNASN